LLQKKTIIYKNNICIAEKSGKVLKNDLQKKIILLFYTALCIYLLNCMTFVQ